MVEVAMVEAVMEVAMVVAGMVAAVAAMEDGHHRTDIQDTILHQRRNQITRGIIKLLNSHTPVATTTHQSNSNKQATIIMAQTLVGSTSRLSQVRITLGLSIIKDPPITIQDITMALDRITPTPTRDIGTRIKP